VKYSKADIDLAWAMLDKYKGHAVKARRIEFYATGEDYKGKPSIDRITWSVACILGAPINNLGLRVDGCGMDMRFATISDLNYRAAMRDLEARCPGQGLSIHSKEGKAALGLPSDANIYDTYFFDANRL
jgi:hypothetical protein